MPDSTVTGSIVFPENASLNPNARVRVRLVDSTAQDDESKVIAETILDHIDAQVKDKRAVEFKLTGPEPPANADCSVEVHVDVDGAGFDRLNKGDFLHARRYNVITYGRPRDVQVNLQQI
jgi:uncharacterized lipoprotein YbaY